MSALISGMRSRLTLGPNSSYRRCNFQDVTQLMSQMASFQGDYFNDEEVRLMLAREAAEERRRRIEEAEEDEKEQEEARREEGKRKKRGIIVAS